MQTLTTWLKQEWATSSPLRHAVGAFLAVELAPYATQVYDWSMGSAALPDWHLALNTLGKAIVGAVMLFLLRRWQQPKPQDPTANQAN